MSDNYSVYELLNCIISAMPDDNPIEDFEKMYCSVNPGMIMKAIQEARRVVTNHIAKTPVDEDNTEEDANVFVTIGGDGYNQSFYNGIIAALLWLPNYIKTYGDKCGVSEKDMETTLRVLQSMKLPQAHDVREETINNTKVQFIPSTTKHYSAFLGAITQWLSNGVTDIKIKKSMKSNMELVRYLANSATRSFPSVPFGAYYVGTTKTTKEDMFKLSETLGKSFNWTDYMTAEAYTLNEPKFVVTSNNAPIVGITGHPLSETFIAEVKDGKTKWIGMFMESEEFAKQCAQAGLSSDMIKKYIIKTSPEEHQKHLRNKHPCAQFIEKNLLTKQCFNWRHEMSSVECGEFEEDYM